MSFADFVRSERPNSKFGPVMCVRFHAGRGREGEFVDEILIEKFFQIGSSKIS